MPISFASALGSEFKLLAATALKMKEVWSIRATLDLKKRVRGLARCNLAIDSKLREAALA